MKKMLSFLVFCSMICSLFSVTFIYAEELNVKDCLEHNEDCLENMEQPKEIMDQEESVVGNETINRWSLALHFIKMIVALFLVLALIYLLLTTLKKRNSLFRQVQVLENLGGIPLGQHKSIQLVRIGTKVYVIGVGNNVELLQEVTDESVKAALLQKDEPVNTDSFIQKIFSANRSLQLKKQHAKSMNFTNELEKELMKIKKNRNGLIHKFTMKDDEHV